MDAFEVLEHRDRARAALASKFFLNWREEAFEVVINENDSFYSKFLVQTITTGPSTGAYMEKSSNFFRKLILLLWLCCTATIQK